MAKSKSSTQLSFNTLAQDIMSTVLVVIRTDQTYREAVEILTQNRLTALPVIDTKGALVGIIGEKDILRAMESFDDVPPAFMDAPIQYQPVTQTARADTPVEEVRSILANGKFRHVLITDQTGALKGVITRRDLIRVIYLRLELLRGTSG